MSLSYDFTFLPQLEEEQYHNLENSHAEVQRQKKSGSLGFTRLPYNELAGIQELAEQIRTSCHYLIVIGIGGSDLGSRAVHRALNHQFYNLLPEGKRPGPKLFFVGDTTDPQALQEVLDIVDMKQAAITIISKSGNTIEQMSTFVYLRQKLLEAVSVDEAREKIVVITDAESGTLREIVNKEGYPSLVVPGDVGGRFSVFSTVGLFPLAVAGVDIQNLLAGAREVDKMDEQRKTHENPAALFALHQYVAATKHGQPISVLMPYTYALREVGFWYRQLWAESLGKRLNKQGEVVEVGPTPIAAVGPTDQHSQLQLYSEGPRDKVITFIAIKQAERDFSLPEAYPELEGVAYLKDKDMGAILLAEQKATALALKQSDRPSSCITLDRLDAQHIGMLLYFFELAVTYAGQLYNINTFDQPGVELSKQLMYGLLERTGFTHPELPPAEAHAVLTV